LNRNRYYINNSVWGKTHTAYRLCGRSRLLRCRAVAAENM